MKRSLLVILLVLILATTVVCGVACNKTVKNLNLSFIVDGEVYSVITTDGESIVAIPDNPKKEGYVFDGWYWDDGVWAKPFTANSLMDAPISSDMAVYAKFSLAEYSIEYEGFDGINPNKTSLTMNDTFLLQSVEKEGYTFNGWYTDSQKTNKITEVKGVTGNLVLYADFEAIEYKITYVDEHNAVNSNPTVYTIESEDIVLAPLSLEGYTFKYWQKNGGGQFKA